MKRFRKFQATYALVLVLLSVGLLMGSDSCDRTYATVYNEKQLIDAFNNGINYITVAADIDTAAQLVVKSGANITLNSTQSHNWGTAADYYTYLNFSTGKNADSIVVENGGQLRIGPGGDTTICLARVTNSETIHALIGNNGTLSLYENGSLGGGKFVVYNNTKGKFTNFGGSIGNTYSSPYGVYNLNVFTTYSGFFGSSETIIYNAKGATATIALGVPVNETFLPIPQIGDAKIGIDNYGTLDVQTGSFWRNDVAIFNHFGATLKSTGDDSIEFTDNGDDIKGLGKIENKNKFPN